jgi:transaldolase
MRLFLDTADLEEIRRALATGMLDGVTTNPCKIAASGLGMAKLVREICSLVPGPVSVEAVADEVDEIVAKAVEISSLAPNVVVKVPMTPAGLRAAQVLEREKNVRVNVTMVFAPDQACLAMKTGASIVSLVLSRLDAAAADGMLLVEDAVKIKRNYHFTTDVLAASLKSRAHVVGCMRAGIDIATLPESLFAQLFRHPLTDEGLAEFAEAWTRVKP